MTAINNLMFDRFVSGKRLWSCFYCSLTLKLYQGCSYFYWPVSGDNWTALSKTRKMNQFISFLFSRSSVSWLCLPAHFWFLNYSWCGAAEEESGTRGDVNIRESLTFLTYNPKLYFKKLLCNDFIFTAFCCFCFVSILNSVQMIRTTSHSSKQQPPLLVFSVVPPRPNHRLTSSTQTPH